MAARRPRLSNVGSWMGVDAVGAVEENISDDDKYDGNGSASHMTLMVMRAEDERQPSAIDSRSV